MLFSVPKVDATFDLPLFDVYKKELTIRGSFVNPDTHARAVAADQLRQGGLWPPSSPTASTLDQLPEAIAMQMSDASPSKWWWKPSKQQKMDWRPFASVHFLYRKRNQISAPASSRMPTTRLKSSAASDGSASL